jgi:signal transduction histidine kinase
VRLSYGAEDLVLEVEDHGQGLRPEEGQHGIGMVAMRERAELIHGTLEYQRPETGGTRVRLSVPREQVEAHAG